MSEQARILIVDDDASTRRTLSLILQKKGYAVEMAETGQLALTLARQQPFDAALLDIRLPDMEGVELLAPLKRMRPDMVLILATGYASVETAIRALNEGADAYVTKPLDMDAVLARLEDLLERQHLIRENRRLYDLVQQELEERRRAENRLQQLYQTSRALSSSLDEESAIHTILGAVYRTLGCEHVLLSTVDEQAGTIGIRHGIWNGQFDVLPEWIEMSQYALDTPDILTDIVRTGKTEIIGEWDDRFNRAIWDRFGHERFLRIFMPLKMQNRVLGVVEVAYDKAAKPAIAQDEIETLAAFADQAAAALENARLFTETERRAARLQAMYEIDQAILAAHSPEEIALAALAHTRQLVPGTAGYVALFEKGATELVVLVTDTDWPAAIQVGSRFAVQGAAEFQTLLQGELISDSDLAHKSGLPPAVAALQAAGIRAYVAAPLRIQDELIGLLLLAADRPQRFTAEHQEILREVSNQVAMALHGARTEAARRAESQRLRMLVNNMPEGVLLLNPDNQIVLSNPVGDEMLAWLDVEHDQPLTHLGPHALADMVNADLAGSQALTLQEPPRSLEVAAYAIETQAVENRGTLVLLRDVTELRQAQELARQQDRLAAVGRLAGGVAHDFNNLLTAITGYTDFVRDSLRSDNPLDWPSGPEIRADLEQVSLAAGRAAVLTRQLLTFSRKEAVQPQVFDLNTLVSNMSKMLTPLIGEDIRLTLSTAEGPELIEADAGQIEQVVMNLAVNARDAMPRGGPLTIETGHVEWSTPHGLSHSRAEAGAYVRLTVRDAGIGMSKQVLSHLFEPFFTTKVPGKGTGLGLATVYGIVQQSNGHIHVQSEPGQGTTFDIYLPRVAGQAHAVAEGRRAETEPGGADDADAARRAHPTETILLVEDEDNVRDLARRILERYGYVVLAARGPAEALLLSERYQAVIDLLLTDMVMPGMNGLALAERLVAQRAGIKVLFMSGYTGDVVGHYGIQPDGDQTMPALNLLQKPFEARDLALRVRQTLGEPASVPPTGAAPGAPARTAALRLPETTAWQPDALRALQELRPGEQLCFIYSNEAERRAMIVPFVRQGLEQRQKVLYLADAPSAQIVLQYLQEEGLDVESVLAAGQFFAWTVNSTANEDAAGEQAGGWSPAAMMAWLRAQAEQAVAQGYTALRVTSDMTWVRRLFASQEHLTEFEVLLNEFLPASSLLVVCQYDRPQFDARALLDVLRAHPLVLIDTRIYDNFYYTAAAHAFSSDEAEATLERWIANLESRRQAEAAIRQSELKLRSFIEQSDDAIVLTDEQGRIVEWNQGAERVYGIAHAQAVGRPLWDVQYQAALEERRTPESYQALKKMIQDTLKTGWSPQVNALREVEMLHPDGTRRVLQTLAFAIQTGHGFILASTSRDVTGQKRAQESLIKSEARYRSLIEHLPAIIYETPFGEASPSFYAGPQIERILGFGQKEWTESSKLWLKQIHPDDRVRVLTMLSKSHESGELFSAEYRLISHDGRPIWFHDEAVVVRDDKGTPLFLHGIMLEINERKQAEENLRQYAVRLALLNELGQQIAAELDIEGVLNQAAYLVREGFGYHHVALFALDQAQGELEMRTCAGLYSALFPPGHRLKLGQGVVGWVALHGESLVAGDVRQSPQYVNLYPDLIPTRSELAVPIRTGGEVVGVLDIQSPQCGDFDDNDILVMETLADQIAVAIKNARLYAALAQERANLAQRVEERTAELSLANAGLARAARLKDEFLANMSHELRTPLNAILGLSEALSEEVYGPLTERQSRSLRNIGEAGHHLLSLVNDILDVAKAEAGRLELQTGSVSVRELCQASLGLVRQMAHQKRIQVSSTVDDQVGAIEADQRRLKQVLVNLLSNAVKFTPEGGAVGLDVVGDQEAEAVHLTVWDTGIGIAQEDMEQLFQPFVQLDGGLSRQYAGTGLGLSLAHRLVELHGGGVSVQSRAGQGSRFTVSLPWIVPSERSEAVALPPGDSAAASEPAPEGPGSAPTVPLILLAEDNPVNVSVFQDYLVARGYRVVEARNGLEAIDRAHEQRPALILMDIQMPEMDGLAAIRRLRADADLAQVPIVALTALAMPGDRERCIEAGADDYLSKPVGTRQLVRVIETWLKISQDR